MKGIKREWAAKGRGMIVGRKVLITGEVRAGVLLDGGEAGTTIEEREVGLEVTVMIQDLIKEEKEIRHAVL